MLYKIIKLMSKYIMNSTASSLWLERKDIFQSVFCVFVCIDPSVLVDRGIFLYSRIFPHQFIFLIPVVVLQHLGAK